MLILNAAGLQIRPNKEQKQIRSNKEQKQIRPNGYAY